jgi:hypothetical protein
LSLTGTESLRLACLWISDFIAAGKQPTLELFESSDYEYFMRHTWTETPILRTACDVASELCGVNICLNFFGTVVATFDKTNLFLEIENESMMDDIARGEVTEHMHRALSEIYDGSPFPAAVVESGGRNLYLPVVQGTGHYPTIAQMNHSCDPNVEWRSVSGTSMIEILALKSIGPGEELLLSYIDQTLPLKERRAELLRLYGFVCKCPKCSLEELENT